MKRYNVNCVNQVPAFFHPPPVSYDLQTEVFPNEEDQSDTTEEPVERFRARGLGETRHLRPLAAKSVAGVKYAPREKRQLQSTTTVRGCSSLQYYSVLDYTTFVIFFMVRIKGCRYIKIALLK